eukprot:GFYU01027650.1.p1 GENE.GFYU01027650.1~~GFYU01027650.1.p1  ORF type:complete len:142 (+),score=26.95 GFYU01027650.1:277-702(+)
MGGVSPSALRCGPHTDINMITLLPPGTASGLEVFSPCCGEWIEVAGGPGEIVVNSGDMLAYVTNGVLAPGMHRVVNTEGSDKTPRLSLPFFYQPNPDAILDPHDFRHIPNFIVPEEGETGHGPPISAIDFLRQGLARTGGA